MVYVPTLEVTEPRSTIMPTVGTLVLVIVNVKVPARVGIPEMLPVDELRANPGGNSP